MKKKILAISGSTRKQSSNEAILKAVIKIYQDTLDIELYNQIDQLPHFNPDIDTDTPPASVKAYRDKIAAADAVLFCTPEYIFSLPGCLKNAIEWSVSTTVFSGKPVGYIVAASAGEKAMEAMELIMTKIESKIAEKSKLLIRGARGKVSIDGEILDQEIVPQFNVLMDALIASID